MIAYDFPTMKVGPNWSDETMSQLYSAKPTLITKSLAFLTDQTPLSSIQFVEKILSDFSLKSQKIAKECKKLSPNEVWKQIACVSMSINSTFQKYKWPSTSHFCRAHAQAFNETFNALNIPNSQAFFWDASTKGQGHVANRITLIGENGRPFSYVIDVGWTPDQIYPLAQLTQEYHSNNGSLLPNIKLSKPSFDFASEKCGLRKNEFSNSIRSITSAIKEQF